MRRSLAVRHATLVWRYACSTRGLLAPFALGHEDLLRPGDHLFSTLFRSCCGQHSAAVGAGGLVFWTAFADWLDPAVAASSHLAAAESAHFDVPHDRGGADRARPAAG